MARDVFALTLAFAFLFVQSACLLTDDVSLEAPRINELIHRPGQFSGVKLHVSSRAKERLLSGPPRYVFGISTGHAGTTSLGSKGSYTGAGLQLMRFDFESVQLARWWDKRPSMDEQTQKAREYKFRIDGELYPNGEGNSTTYVDLGHHILQGIWHSAPAVFGDDLFFVRVRRSRIATARSFLATPGLCQIVFHICPLKNDHVLTPRSGEWGTNTSIWGGLTKFQQFLWFVDEVEAEFQQLLTRNPEVAYLECDWSDDLTPCFRAVAAVLGVDIRGEGLHSNVDHRRQPTSSELHDYESQNAAYHEYMNYSLRDQALIAKAQF